MRPCCIETEDEYKISKYILLQFICSAAVLKAVNGNAGTIVAILHFLQCHVFTHETLYLHYLRKKIRHFDIATSSNQEGANFGTKSHTAAVQPTMDMDNAAQTMNLQSDLKACELEEIVYNDYQKTVKKWSDTLTSPHSTSFGEGLMAEVYKHCFYTS